MRALTWQQDVRVDTVPDPEIVNPRGALIEVTATATCGSDLHLYDAVIPGLVAGDVLGHEFMGGVVGTRPATTLRKGRRVVVPFTIFCGRCLFCEKHQFSACDNSNPVAKQDASETLYGHAMSGLFGYSHLTGGYAGGQADPVRVPFSDVGPIVIPDGLDDEQVLFLSDILPTGGMAADNCDIEEGDTVAVWGCGPVGLFAVQSAGIMGARVIAIDHHPHRLELARSLGAEVIDFEQTSVLEALMEMTGDTDTDFFDRADMEDTKVGKADKADPADVARQGIEALQKGRSGVVTGLLNKVQTAFRGIIPATRARADAPQDGGAGAPRLNTHGIQAWPSRLQ